MNVAEQQTYVHPVASDRDFAQAERRISRVQAQVDRLFAAGRDLSTAASVLATLRTMLTQQRLRQLVMRLHDECSESVLDQDECRATVERRLVGGARTSMSAAPSAQVETVGAGTNTSGMRENEAHFP